MDKLAKKYKLFIIIALIVVVVGMTLFGIFGFNNTVDYSSSYEVRVGIEQSVEDAKLTLKSSADEYLNSKGIKAVDYASQQLNDGKTLVYKFNKDVNIDDADMKTYIQAKFDASQTLVGITVTAEYSEVRGNNPFNVGAVVLALGIALVVAFLFALIMEKLSGALALICTSVASALAFISLLAIVRLPSEPVVAISISLAMVLSAILSCSTIAKCSEKYKLSGETKPNTFEIAEQAIKSENKKYLLIAIALLVASIAISAFIQPYLMFAGAQILLAGLVATAVSYFGTPLMWALIKGAKKSK